MNYYIDGKNYHNFIEVSFFMNRTWFILGRNGRLISVSAGEITDDQIKALVNRKSLKVLV